MNKRVAIFGCAGQLGVELTRVFNERGYQVTGFSRGGVEITDQTSVQQCLESLDPAIVVNAAAYNQVDLAEKEPANAFQSNAVAVRNMAIACRQIDALLVHFSTDYVFDGTAGRPYVETDSTHPLGAYAVSKLAGELYAQAYLEAPLIIRTSGVFGPGGLHTARGNFVELMLRLAGSGQPIRVMEDHVASPTYAPALAEATAQLVEHKQHGVFHAGGGTPISWFDYAKLIFEAAGVKPELRPTDAREYRTAARRPKFSALSNAKMEACGVTPMPAFAAAVASYMQARRRYNVVTGFSPSGLEA